MKRAFHGANILLGLFLFAALGFAIFCGGAYLYAHGLELELPGMQLRVKINWKTPLIIEKYTGPQNAQELMKALDADYNKGHAKTEVSLSRKVTGIETESYSSSLTMREIDARYPRAEWLQLLLERGIIIENLLEYVSNLSQRHALAFLEDNPNLRQSGVLDIPPTDDWETYKAAYIDKLVEIERTKVETELVKAEIERRKPEIERTIERIKEQIERAKVRIEHSRKDVERAKVRIEHSRKDVERAKKELNSQQFEHVRKQLEHARKQLERAQGTLEHLKEPTPPQELTPPEKPK
ncbi:MAG: hypothetical protein OXU27_08740 [Candidatus Poribacteria bacterium]|nr:hypothetical protein [Candidatus Poribacteria bacterium]